MSSVQVFHLPDVGEGLAEAEILTWHVGPGDRVEVNQVIVEIETAKSCVELPSPYAGTVVGLHAEVGETVDVGRPIISISATGAVSDADPDEPALLVGYGAPHTGNRRRRPARVAGEKMAGENKAGEKRTEEKKAGDEKDANAAADRPRATPPVRMLARTLGVDLSLVTPTGPDGRIVRADVHVVADGRGGPVQGPDGEVPAEVRIPIRGVRRHTAAAMVASAFTAPHVTEFITVDVTRMMELRTQIGRRREFATTKLSPLAFAAKALLLAVARTPDANARWDEDRQEIVRLREVNLGIAAATPRGLVVPNIKSAQRLSLLDLARAINDLAATAREGRTDPAAMARGTITITNVGVFGVDSGTPILNRGEAAILAFGAIRRQPWVVQRAGVEEIAPRWVTQLALSFDHRVMDGQEGSQLLADTAAVLAEPGLAIL